MTDLPLAVRAVSTPRQPGDAFSDPTRSGSPASFPLAGSFGASLAGGSAAGQVDGRPPSATSARTPTHVATALMDRPPQRMWWLCRTPRAGRGPGAVARSGARDTARAAERRTLVRPGAHSSAA